jgi:hypothetical protein
VNEHGFAVRGILSQVAAGQLEIDIAEDVINIMLETSCEKGYAEGVVDTLKTRSEVTEGRGKGELTPSGISVRAELMQSL